MSPSLDYAFMLHVDLALPQCFGKTSNGDRRFIPIIGGYFEGLKIKGKILPGSGDWNAVRSDGVIHVLAKCTIQAEDGTPINLTNEVYGRASQKIMDVVFRDGPSKVSMANGGADCYTKTFPRFEITDGPHAWLNSACFVGDLLPP
jgi:hypothetical protein